MHFNEIGSLCLLLAPDRRSDCKCCKMFTLPGVHNSWHR